VNSVFHNYFANNVLVSNAVAELCGGDDDTDYYVNIDDDYQPVNIIKISISPDPPVERDNITIEALTADTVTVQLVENEIDIVGTPLYPEKIDSYKWRCFIPSNSAGKFVYIQASNLEGAKGRYWSQAILENQTPPQKFELILDTYPFGLALDVFKLYPDPVEILTPTDGRVHAVYEEGTRVYITAQNYEDYVFEYWTGTGIEGTSSDNPLVTIMNQDKEYIAYYKEETEQPRLSFSPEEYNETLSIKEIKSVNLYINNTGTGVLYYNLSVDKDWLLVTPSKGSSSGETDEVVVTIDASSLDVGKYFGNVYINCSNGENATIPVNLTVVANPFLDFNPSSRILAGRKGDIITSFFYIQNLGTGSLRYTLTPDKSWIQLSTYSGYSSGEKDKIQITINTTLLNPGIYSGNISIECGSGGTGIFKITLYLSPPQPEKAIEIITPNGGENWQIGGIYEIRWRSTGNVGEKVKIELYRGNNLFKILSTNISNVGNCKWVISTDIPPGYEYRIKISSSDNEEIYDFSDGVFSLYTPSTVHFLYISSPPVCYEKQPFSITVYDEGGNIVKGAKISLYGQNVVTDSEGKASPLFAPEVERDTQIFIVASKLGYVYATATILVKDVEKLIKIDAPKKVKEGENFTVSVVFYNVLDPRSPSYIVLDAEVEFDNETKEVDEFGKVKFRAPKVENNIRLPITVYIDFFDTTTTTYLLIENSENMDIAGAIKKVFTQTWLILFAAILFTIFTTFILLTFKRKSRKINIIAPVHVGSNKEFIVRVKDNKDRAIPDAIVEFNGVTKKTDRRGMVKFKAPNTTEIKELYITAEKDNISESIPIMVGSISPHKELYPYMNPPSITEEEIQVFSPIDKRQLESTQAKQSQTQELPKIATASNEIINKLIDAVLEKHKRK